MESGKTRRDTRNNKRRWNDREKGRGRRTENEKNRTRDGKRDGRPSDSKTSIDKRISEYEKEIDRILDKGAVDDDFRVYVLSNNLLSLRIERLAGVFQELMDKS